jgi:hypothetical protein
MPWPTRPPLPSAGGTHGGVPALAPSGGDWLTLQVIYALSGP